MNIVKHPLCTATIGAPSDMQDNCSALPVAYYTDEHGTWAVSFWKPEARELVALNAGGGITLHVRAPGRQHPVVAMGIYDALGSANTAGSEPMNDISIDLETLSTRFDAAILSIGAVSFDRNTGEIGERLYVEVEVTDSIAHGHVSGSTLEWWAQQSEKARQMFGAQGKSTLASALCQLSTFVAQHHGAKVWGNGATFDITILEHAYAGMILDVPWNFWDIRDMRTIVEAATEMGFDKCSAPFAGTEHNALDDAVHQARVIARSWTYCCARNAVLNETAEASVPPHSDDLAVDAFAAAMKAKLAKQRAKGYRGWDDHTKCSVESLAVQLIQHIPKGDVVDIANFAMMLHQRGAPFVDFSEAKPDAEGARS